MLLCFVTIVFLWLCDPSTIDDTLQEITHMLETECEHQWVVLTFNFQSDAHSSDVLVTVATSDHAGVFLRHTAMAPSVE